MTVSSKAVRRAFIVAHFERDGVLDPHVHATLKSISGAASDILLVSTNLREGENLTGTGVGTVIRRENSGYDFRSWQVGLRALGRLDGYDEVVLLNNSFYLARENALTAALDTMAKRRCDVWALTASRQHRFHLQSYFMAFRPVAFGSAWFKRFWNDVSQNGDRADVIRRHELQMASQARSAGLRVAALLSPPLLPTAAFLAHRWAVRTREAGQRAAAVAMLDTLRGEPGENPMLHHWREASRTCGVVKIELLRSNPLGTDLSRVETTMEPACWARARAHLSRTTAPAAQTRIPA